MSSAPRILLIDDHRSNAEIRALLLRQFGCEAVVCTTSDAGLDELRANAFDLVLIDYHLASDETGDKLALHIRAEWPDLPLIMLTGDMKVPDSARACVDAVLIKGASSPADLWEAIQNLLPDGKKMRPRRPPAVFPVSPRST